jgi:predicted anti-sigma-YlaC factor YlaD
MNKCARIKKLLSRYLDKETSGIDNKFIETHLNDCFLCKNDFLELSKIKSTIGEKERKILPQDYLIFRLREKIEKERKEKERFLWLVDISNFSRKLMPVPVTVIVAMIVFLIFTPNYYIGKSSLEEHMLSGNNITTQTALELILGIKY